jgi:hypothetical protein
VTGQAHLIGFDRLHLLDFWHVTTGVVLDMRLSRSMTALAPLRGRGRSWVLCLSVGSAFELFTLFFVTLQALGGAHVAPGSRWSRRRLLTRGLCRRRFGARCLRSRLRRRAEGNGAGCTNRDCRSENACGYQTEAVMHGNSPHTNACLARSLTGSPRSFLDLLYDPGVVATARDMPESSDRAAGRKFFQTEELDNAVVWVGVRASCLWTPYDRRSS